MPEDVKEDIEVEFEEVEVETEASKSDEIKEKAEKFREDFRTKAEARTEANKEKLDETLNKSKDVAGKVGENLSKTIDDTIIAMKALQKNFDTRYQGYKETVATGNISIDLAENKDFYYLQAYLAGIEKEALDHTMVTMSDIKKGISIKDFVNVLFEFNNMHQAKAKKKEMGRLVPIGHNIPFDNLTLEISAFK